MALDNYFDLINIGNTWIDVQTLAALKGITQRAVRLSLRQDKYISKAENVRGGKCYKIKLSSLESKLQSKYMKEYYNNITETDVRVELEKLEQRQEKIITEHQKKIALSKINLLRFWDKFREECKPQNQANKKFLELYNTGELYPQIFEEIGKASIGSLYRWKLALGEAGNDWTILISNYKHSPLKTYRTSLNEDEIKIFLKILLSQNKFSIGKSISLTKHILSQRGVQILPKDVTFRRYANWYKKVNYDKWVLARDGMKGLKDKVEPYIVRDASLLETGQVLVADGKTLNFQVVNPFTGKPCKATLLGFLDWKSGALVGYEIMLEECTQSIASALRNAILKLGRIPSYVYQDNGRAFRSKFFNGDKNFEELGFTGIYEKLGITPIYAIPYNARAKVIERFFLDMQESFEKLLPSYIGTSIEQKPAYMKRNEKFHKENHSDFVPTFEQANDFIQKWLEFKYSQPCSNAENKTIQEVLDEVEKQNINIDELDDLMMAQEVKTIGRNGIRFLKSDYFDDTLYGLRDKVIIKYSLFDLSYIKVYSTKGEYLCTAMRVMSTHPLANYLGSIKDVEDYKQKIVKQKRLRNKTLKAVKEHFSISEINLIEEQISEKMPSENTKFIEVIQPETKLIPIIKPDEILARPLFKTSFERYEWHLKNGCISGEDSEWFDKYKKTDEYKMIYES